ncbi:RING-H2 finger protein ATL40-like [Macadamia integrifolia]|uniref:RING-H2 finger protein ATL40-like n=1 Tax=Macadamia integrifolia TaxID=60698 RepID=UPI001C52F668|nr:RING-H2 finger protein ATL40-like [Macadamia integrifolia]
MANPYGQGSTTFAPTINGFATTINGFATTINGAATLIILVLTLLIVLHTLRCINEKRLQRHYMRHSSGGDQPQSQLFIAIGGATLQFPSLEPPKNGGLHPSVIAALPTFIYKKPNQINTITECSICLSSLEEEEMVRLLPNCLHVFHAQCIDRWLSSQTTCPICRAVAEPQALPVVAAEHEQDPAEDQSHGTGNEAPPPPPPPPPTAPV